MKRRALGALIFGVLIAALLSWSACASVYREGSTYSRQSGDAGEAEYREAVKLQSLGRYDEALALLEKVAGTHPDSAFADDCFYRIGLIHLERNELVPADQNLTRLVTQYPRSRLARDGWFKLGLIRYDLQRYGASIEAMEAYLQTGEGLNLAGKAQAHIGRCYVELGDFPKALAWYQGGLLGSRVEENRRIILGEVDDVLQTYTASEALEPVLADLHVGPVHERARMRLADLYRQEGKADLAALILDDLRDESASGSMRVRAAKELATFSGDGLGEGPAIGVLLPLSGRFGVYGQEVLKGVLLGINFFEGPTEGQTPPRVLIEDTRGDPDVAAEAVARLAANRNVVCLIGPLMSQTADRAAEAAEAAHIPIILMSRKEGLTRGRRFVFRHFLTGGHQVRALVEFVNSRYMATKFAVLYPENDHGREYRDLMAAEIVRLGLEMVAIVGYAPGAADFREPIARLKAAARAGGGMDALFVPDYAEQMMIIAPQLVYRDLDGMYLLGTNEWDSEALADQTSAYLTRSIFTDAFFIGSQRPEVVQFVERYSAHDEGEPNVLSAFGFDNARLSAWLIDAREARTRDEFRNQLLRLEDVSGVTGSIGFDAEGDSDLGMTFLRIRSGRIEEIP